MVTYHPLQHCPYALLWVGCLLNQKQITCIGGLISSGTGKLVHSALISTLPQVLGGGGYTVTSLGGSWHRATQFVSGCCCCPWKFYCIDMAQLSYTCIRLNTLGTTMPDR